MARRHPRQESLFNRSGGPRQRRSRTFARGKRPGRPPEAGARLRHAARPELGRRFPVHVTWRVRGELSNLRGPVPMRALRAAFQRGKQRCGFRLVHFSVQRHHVHLLCEAEDARSLARGLQGLAVRVARGLNRALGRKGKVFSDRYHSRILCTPSEARWALGYVLCNTRRHNTRRHNTRRHNGQLLTPKRYARRWLDASCSSAPHFPGFVQGDDKQPVRACELGCDSLVVRVRTWLLGVGWRRVGALPSDHLPGPRAG